MEQADTTRGADSVSERIELMMPKLIKSAGVTEELKSTDQMKWVGLMENCKSQAEELVLTELVYD